MDIPAENFSGSVESKDDVHLPYLIAFLRGKILNLLNYPIGSKDLALSRAVALHELHTSFLLSL